MGKSAHDRYQRHDPHRNEPEHPAEAGGHAAVVAVPLRTIEVKNVHDRRQREDEKRRKHEPIVFSLTQPRRKAAEAQNPKRRQREYAVVPD